MRTTTEERERRVSIERIFLGWNRPALPAAVEYLRERFRQGERWDLDRLVIVLPGGRAGRRLRELLLAAAEAERVTLFPPRITTVGQLPELLYDRKLPFASTLVQQLAWASAIRQIAPEVLARFLTEVPRDEQDPQWLELGTLLWRQHRELAGDGLDFEQVARRGAKLDAFREAARWSALAEVQRKYLQILDGLGLWDRQTARLYAIEHRECHTHDQLLLIGAVDMNQSLRQMLDQVHRQVTVLIQADPSMADDFDEHGCVRPDRWQAATIPLHSSQIQQVDGPDDQCQAVADCLAEWASRYATDQVTVGVPDESLVPLLEQHLHRAGWIGRWGPGRTVEASRPVRLLRAIVDYLQQDRFENLAELVRHPDMTAWLTRGLDWSADLLIALDRYQNEYLPQHARGPRLPSRGDFPANVREGEAPAEPDSVAVLARQEPRPPDSETSSKEAADLVREVARCVSQLLDPLRGAPRPADQWTVGILDVLQQLYGDQVLDRHEPDHRMVLEGCEAIRDAIVALESIPAAVRPEVTADQAILLSLEELADRFVPPPLQADAVELLGWLELALDDAPALVVTSMNEGVVPTSVNSDLFLPDALRSQLGVDDNARRYARDAYALTVLTHTRSDLHLVLGRRTWEGNPLVPSRLLLATDPDALIPLALQLFGPVEQQEEEPCPAEVEGDPGMEQSLVVPGPRPTDPIRVLNVTDLKSYRACPYRFYLSRILRLETFSDDAAELDAMAFGDLLHRVLDEFGRGPTKDAEDDELIAQSLVQLLSEFAEARFGTDPAPALRIQLAQAEHRLRAFAGQQAAWRRQGWRIVHTERTVTTAHTPWDQEELPVRLRGRIDRIDQQEGTGRWAVLDYKSSDRGEGPRASHHLRSRGRDVQPEDWFDWQLPLYRYLAKDAGASSDEGLVLGYVVLPRDPQGTAFALADWSDAELKTADQVACQIARDIYAGRFWPPNPMPAYGPDEFSAICQDGVFHRRLDAAVGEEVR